MYSRPQLLRVSVTMLFGLLTVPGNASEKPPLLSKSKQVVSIANQKAQPAYYFYEWLSNQQVILVNATSTSALRFDLATGKETNMKDWTEAEQKQAITALDSYFAVDDTKMMDIEHANSFHEKQPGKTVTLQNFSIQLQPYTFVEDFAVSPSGKMAVWSIRVPALSPVQVGIHRVFPQFKVTSRFVVKLVSTQRGTSNYNEIGWLDDTPHPEYSKRHQLGWTKDGKGISFLYGNALYILPFASK